MKATPISVRIADLPQVQEAVRTLANERDDLRSLVRVFEERVACQQCGKRYSESACGPSHATVWHLIDGAHDG